MSRSTLKHILFLALCTSILFGGCHKKKTVFESHFLYGKWVCGTEYYRFDANGNGATWDTSDDVDETEAQQFTWSFDSESNRLTIVHQMEMGGNIPKSYTVTMLNELFLRIKDRYGQSTLYIREN